MPRVSRRARVAYSAEQMFRLVNDVEAYPKFLHWCSGARIQSATADEVVAELDIGLGGMHKSFRTRNRLTHPTPAAGGRIDLELVSGPFRHLNGGWTFTPTDDGGCDVSLILDYELSHSPLGLVLGAVFDEVARSQMDAFVRRAGEVYVTA